MVKHDDRIDSYIEKSAQFAKPILKHLRTLVHSNCREIEETMKWNFPHFLYRGKILCSMAAFKQHCAFSFWKASEMDDVHSVFKKAEEKSMGNLGRLVSVKQIPSSKLLREYFKQAMDLSDGRTKVKKTLLRTKAEMSLPEDFQEQLLQNKAACLVYESLPPSHKREYLSWVTDAKREETRLRRIHLAIKQLSEGKSRNWQYEKPKQNK